MQIFDTNQVDSTKIQRAASSGLHKLSSLAVVASTNQGFQMSNIWNKRKVQQV